MRHPVLVVVLLVGLCSEAYAQNLLIEPSFEDWTKAWVRGGTMPGSAHWDSKWINRTDSHTGNVFMMAVKHDKLVPADDVTPTDVHFFQNVGGIRPGGYEASLWFKIGGDGTKWDGPGAADQWTQIVVYLWADEARTELVRVVTSPKLETPVPQWHKFGVRFDVPKKVKSISYYAYARFVDRYPTAWAAWDDAYLGPADKTSGTSAQENLFAHGDLPIGVAADAQAFMGRGGSIPQREPRLASRGQVHWNRHEDPAHRSVLIEPLGLYTCGNRRTVLVRNCQTLRFRQGDGQNGNPLLHHVAFTGEASALHYEDLNGIHPSLGIRAALAGCLLRTALAE